MSSGETGSGETGYEIAYREATRAISDQQGILDSIQSRIGIVASAGALLFSLSAQRAAGSGELTGAIKFSIAASLLLFALAAYVLWPRRKWRFHFGVQRLHSHYIEHAEPLSAALMMRDLALHLDRYFSLNGRALDRMAWAFSGSLLALLVEAAAYSYDVLGGV